MEYLRDMMRFDNGSSRPFWNYRMVNMNKDSTHPNPWRPPNHFESSLKYIYDPMFITTKRQLIYYTEEKRPLDLEENPLNNMVFWGWQGFKFGSCLAVNDTFVVQKINCWKTILTRCAYLCPIYGCMPISYVGFRHFLGQFSKEKNSLWTYPAAIIAPLSIFTAYTRDWERGVRPFVLGCVCAFAFKFFHDNGLVEPAFNQNVSSIFEHDRRPYSDKATGYAKRFSEWPEHWKHGGKVYYGKVVEPGWKKWLDPEDRDKGPSL